MEKVDSNIFRLHSLNYTNHFLRHKRGRVLLECIYGVNIFDKIEIEDSKFKLVPGLANPSDESLVSFESVNYPGNYLHVGHWKRIWSFLPTGDDPWQIRNEFELWLDHSPATIYVEEFNRRATFRKKSPNKDVVMLRCSNMAYPHYFMNRNITISNDFRIDTHPQIKQLWNRDLLWITRTSIYNLDGHNYNLISFESVAQPGHFLGCHQNQSIQCGLSDGSADAENINSWIEIAPEPRSETFKGIDQNLSENPVKSFKNFKYQQWMIRHQYFELKPHPNGYPNGDAPEYDKNTYGIWVNGDRSFQLYRTMHYPY